MRLPCSVILELTDVFNQRLNGKACPGRGVALVHLLPKLLGATLVKDYRPIASLCAVEKVYER
eukprot:10196135-Alexandrium_andersonii.AAC.1